MSFLIYTLALLFILFPDTLLAETTRNAGTAQRVQAVNPVATAPSCSFNLRRGWNIRRNPSYQGGGNVCDSTRRLTNGTWGSVTPIGMVGDWVRIAASQCPRSIGYVHKRSFSPTDRRRLDAGQYCREAGVTAFLRAAQAPEVTAPTEPPAQQRGSEVRSLNNRGHEFPLPACLGLKNGGGLGHYGAPRRNGNRRYRHTGCDYYSPQGTAVKSPCSGRIIQSNNGSRAGNTIRLRCDNGDQFTFMHLHNSQPRRRAPVGPVTQGAVIGGVGNTGNARRQAPHLHLEAVIGGRRVDPQSLWDCGGDSGH
jgi:murein DD-endopeptidase MepM/ murein hydrolase activator NlpD